MRTLPTVDRPPPLRLVLLVGALLAAVAFAMSTGGDEEPTPAGSSGTVYANGAGPAPRNDTETMRQGTFGRVLTIEQIALFERVNSKLVNLNNATGAPLDPRISQLEAACGRLDPAVPMLAAFAKRCDPSIRLAQLSELASARCDGSGGTGPCARLLVRMATALSDLAAANRQYKLSVKAVTDDRTCLAKLVPSARSTVSMKRSAAHAREASRALVAGDEPGFQSALQDFQGSIVHALDENGEAQPIVDAIREACGMVKTLSPPGERTN